MSEAALIFEVGESGFDRYVIDNSHKVPVLVEFMGGEVVLNQAGQIREDELRVLLRGLGVFRESDEMRAQAREKHMAGDTPGAIVLLTEAIRKDPGNTRVAMDMVQSTSSRSRTGRRPWAVLSPVS